MTNSEIKAYKIKHNLKHLKKQEVLEHVDEHNPITEDIFAYDDTPIGTRRVEQSKTRQKRYGEVFTPSTLVNEMLDKLPKEAWSKPFKKTILDPAAGNGNFLIAVLKRCLAAGDTHRNALSRIYGVELMEDNYEQTKKRLDPRNEHGDIVNLNIICADFLRCHKRFDGTPPYFMVDGKPDNLFIL